MQTCTNRHYGRNSIAHVGSSYLGQAVIVVGPVLGHAGRVEPLVPVDLGHLGLVLEVSQQEGLELLGVDGLVLELVVVALQEGLELG